MNEKTEKSSTGVVAELHVEGMSCPGCEAAVESILLGLDGVRKAKASFTGSTVTIEYNTAVTGIQGMKEALGKAGYTLGSEVQAKGAGKKLTAWHFIVVALLLCAACFIIGQAAGIHFTRDAKSTNAVTAEKKTGSVAVQNITSVLVAGSYPVLTVQKGVSVKWDLQADASILNSCNGTLVIPKFNIEKKLQPGDNIIEFTPTEAGTVPYSCKMGMIRSNITVVD